MELLDHQEVFLRCNIMKDNRQVIILILVLALLLILFRRVSGFIVTPTQVPLSMMDLQEFSYLTDDQKNRYRGLLTSRAPLFTSNTSNYTMYMQNVQGLMSNVIAPMSGTVSMTPCPNSNILMGVCQTVPGRCPPPMTSVLNTNGNKYCMCPPATPYFKPVSGTMNGSYCSVTPCAPNERTITETATGQRQCTPSSTCPPLLQSGVTCM